VSCIRASGRGSGGAGGGGGGSCGAGGGAAAALSRRVEGHNQAPAYANLVSGARSATFDCDMNRMIALRHANAYPHAHEQATSWQLHFARFALVVFGLLHSLHRCTWCTWVLAPPVALVGGTSTGRHAQTYNTRVQSKVRSLANLAAASAGGPGGHFQRTNRADLLHSWGGFQRTTRKKRYSSLRSLRRQLSAFVQYCRCFGAPARRVSLIT
jgi:hypothetical protein